MVLRLRTKKIVAFSLFLCFTVSLVRSQSGVNSNSGIINTVTTAVPFLRIDPDARAGGMGDMGIASPTDANGLYMNPAKMAFIQTDYGFSMGFTPWLKALVNDIYLANLTGYYKVKKMQTIAVSLRYFSLGNIQFTDINGNNLNQFRPNEFAIDVHYARVLGKYFSIAASLRYIYSNLAGGQNVSGLPITAGQAGSGDISWYFKKKFNENNEHKFEHEFSCGMYVSNIGSKISYTSSTVKDFIPTNLGIGVGYTVQLDKHNSLGIYCDANKLLVPTPDTAIDPTTYAYKYREESSIQGIFSSFTAPGGFSEEMRQITISTGAEYFYNKQFGIRTGYFYEPYSNGGRQYLTAGLTVKYSLVSLHFSYLIPTTIIRNPLENTLRFTLVFDFMKGGVKKNPNNQPVSLEPDSPRKNVRKAQAIEPEQNQTPQSPPPPATNPPAPTPQPDQDQPAPK